MRPLLKKYGHRRHPLDYKNRYQLLVMVVLSAQTTDSIVNAIAPELFAAYPDMRALARAKAAKLIPYVQKLRNFRHKIKWLLEIASTLKDDKHIPQTLDELTSLPGIGRKSANVILRESDRPPEGVVVDLHVVRVAPRLGIATGDDPKKIEQQIMQILPPAEWDAGMAMSFLGREICLPKPKCEECLMKKVCAYYATTIRTPHF